MKLEIKDEGVRIWMSVSEDVNKIDDVAGLSSEIEKYISRFGVHVILDVTSCGFITSSFCGAVIKAKAIAVKSKSKLSLIVPPQGCVGELLRIAGINMMVDIYPTKQVFEKSFDKE